MNQNGGGPPVRAPRPDKLSPLGSGGAEGAAAELADGEHALGLALDLADALAGDAELVGELGQGGHPLVGRLPLELHRELVKGPGHLADLVAPMDRHPYGAALVGDGALYGLADPPRRVRGEPPPALRVELLYGLHQADVALLDQVLERQPLPAVLLGYAHH